MPPGKWPIARIAEVHRGSDNKVRVVTIEKHSARIDAPIPTKLDDYLEKLTTHKSVLDRPIDRFARFQFYRFKIMRWVVID